MSDTVECTGLRAMWTYVMEALNNEARRLKDYPKAHASLVAAISIVRERIIRSVLDEERAFSVAVALLAEADEYTWHYIHCPLWDPPESDPQPPRESCDCDYFEMQATVDKALATYSRRGEE